jgi:class 3 adenylate cyclase/tetratricopeptide (TPR) repeat protein
VPACPACGEENPERARFCWSCGTQLAEPVRSAVEERKVVSVLFVDLVGFTAASETSDPEDVRARLRPYHARVKQEIERFGGTVEKFVGDAVMAVFGAPVAHEDDAERAVTAALRILTAIDDLNEETPGLELSVRGAVNTGEAMVTLSARPAEGEGIVAGDVVNTASRLQGAAPVGGIVVGEATYRTTRDLFEYEPLEAVTVKGKQDPLPIWRATAARRRFGVDVDPTPQTPLIGRDDDLALLRSTFARSLRDSSTQLVTVTGEPGVGKTRLLAEFRLWVDDRPELVFWRQGRSLPYGEGISYWALGEMVKAQAGILESDTSEEAVAKLTVAIAEATEDAAERDWLNARLGPLVGAGGAAAGEREESFTAWRRFVEGVAAQRPLILVFEDLHWADDALLAFVEHLVDWSTDVALLVLCTARPELYERHPGWGGGKRNSNTISLFPLAPDDTARLIAALLHKAVLPAETQKTLLEQAGGNPLYAEEFVRMLADRGVLTEDGALRETDIPVPESVQALIAARLDTLPPDRKALLHDAAVVGKVFWAGVVAAMGDREPAAVRDGLHELARKELVRSARTSSVKEQAEYSFWHLLVRDVAYGQIPRADRARKHVAAARWIESMAGERLIDHAELLAYHYEQALDLARATGSEEDELVLQARRFIVLAGDRATSLDLTKAHSYYLRAADLYGPDEQERADVLCKAGWCQIDRAASGTHVDEALALYRRYGNEVGEGGALVLRAHLSFLAGERARTEESMSAAISLLERHPPGRELAEALTRRIGGLAIGGRSREALDEIEDALSLVERLGFENLEGRLLQYRGISRCELGDPDGLDDIERGLEVGLDAGDLNTAGIGYSNLGSLAWMVRGPEASADVYRNGIEFTERRGMLGNEMWLKAEMTWSLFDLGQWAEVLRLADQVIEWERDRPAGYHTLIALPQKALVLVQRGQIVEASALVDDFLSRSRVARDPQALAPALSAAAAVAAAKGDLPAAVELVQEYEAAIREAPSPQASAHLPELVRIALAGGDHHLGRRLLELSPFEIGRAGHAVVAAKAVHAEGAGETEAALALHREAAERWAGYGYVLGQASSLFGAGRCLLGLGRPFEAASPLTDARELFKSLGATPSVERVDETLARATSVSA